MSETHRRGLRRARRISRPPSRADLRGFAGRVRVTRPFRNSLPGADAGRQTGNTMGKAADQSSNLLPTAKQLMEKVAIAEAEKASEAMRQKAKADAEKKALIDRLTKPSGVSEEDRMKRAAAIINRAVKNGLTEVEVTRFPNTLCTDRGRAINNELEAGWEDTLTGLPKELYEFWERQLKPRGYKIRYQVADFKGGVPGDIS